MDAGQARSETVARLKALLARMPVIARAANEQARGAAVEQLRKLLAAVPVLDLELNREPCAEGWTVEQRERATRALVDAIYAFGGGRADVEEAIGQGREHLRLWLEQRSE